ncbi:uncharacterized protein LOC106407620 [Brassica napus]|uniref:uncharacterized protein LOC106407620 n=1 Tax=Brassica napus TaxID=3708 RepID=UPI000BBE961C|nr:uncharacterized protein LOC106407620 [Brassica napus]XP_022568822.1 uncharacterized protein LOC106407620 [Brassica napus]
MSDQGGSSQGKGSQGEGSQVDPERKYGTIVDINHWKCIFCYKDTQDARLLASCLMALSAMLPPPRLMSSYSISNQEYSMSIHVCCQSHQLRNYINHGKNFEFCKQTWRAI